MVPWGICVCESHSNLQLRSGQSRFAASRTASLVAMLADEEEEERKRTASGRLSEAGSDAFLRLPTFKAQRSGSVDIGSQVSWSQRCVAHLTHGRC